MQKLVFLHEIESSNAFYEFVPYKFGSYSFQLREDLEILQRDHFIFMTSVGDALKVQAVNPVPDRSDYNLPKERGNALIKKVYRAYPYYTINSEILDRIFSGEELKAFKSNRSKYRKGGATLFTIGYEGRSIESFINALLKEDVRLLCDIRKNPLSRKFGFSKGRLSQICKAVGISYVHIPSLGIESEKRSSLESVEDYKTLFAEYENSLTQKFEYLNEAYTLFKVNKRIALMCYEKEPSMCHRHVVSDYLVDTYQVKSVDL
ncbi:MAG: DUF488 domain-containing protein [Sphaerochaeta sp.]